MLVIEFSSTSHDRTCTDRIPLSPRLLSNSRGLLLYSPTENSYLSTGSEDDSI